MNFRILGLLGSLVVSATTLGQPQTEIAPTQSGIGLPGDYLGVALTGDSEQVFAGAYGRVVLRPQNSAGLSTGAVLRFARDAQGVLTFDQLIVPADGAESDLFGGAVAWCAPYLVVGASLADRGADNSGSVYLYERVGSTMALRGQWPGRPVVEGRFGHAVVCAGDRVAVGAPGDNAVGLLTIGDGGLRLQQIIEGEPNSRFGEALAFTQDGLLIAAPAAGKLFEIDASGAAQSSASVPISTGAALAVAQNTVIIGLPDALGQRGSVRHLQRTAGGLLDIGPIEPPGLVAGDRFGAALALSAGGLVVGSPGRTGSEGAVAHFVGAADQLTFVAFFDRNNGGFSDIFGSALWQIDAQLVVGAPLGILGGRRPQGTLQQFSVSAAGLRFTGQTDLGNAAGFSRFGFSIDADADQLLVGAFLADTADGADAGEAYLYQRQAGAWQLAHTLRAPDAGAERRFGISTAIDGSRYLIGAYFDPVEDDLDRGSAYLFGPQAGSVSTQQKIIASDGQPGDFFGFAVDIEGELAVATAPGVIGEAPQEGAAYIFRADSAGTLLQIDRVSSLFPEPFANYGISAMVHQGRIYVGSPFDTVDGVFNAGAVYIYEVSGNAVVLRRRLTETPPIEDGAFGFSLAARGNDLLVGSPLFRRDGQTVGRAVLWDIAADYAVLQVFEPTAQNGDQFGLAVAITDDALALAGSGVDRGGLSDVGAVQLYRRSDAGNWVLGRRLRPSTTQIQAFGRALTFSGSELLVGAPLRGRETPQEGAVFVVDTTDLGFADGFE